MPAYGAYEVDAPGSTLFGIGAQASHIAGAEHQWQADAAAAQYESMLQRPEARPRLV